MPSATRKAPLSCSARARGDDVVNPLEFVPQGYVGPGGEDLILFEDLEMDDATLVWDFEQQGDDEFLPYPDDPNGSYGFVDTFGGEAALAFNDSADSIVLGFLGFQNWQAFPDLNIFSTALHFEDGVIDEPEARRSPPRAATRARSAIS